MTTLIQTALLVLRLLTPATTAPTIELDRSECTEDRGNDEYDFGTDEGMAWCLAHSTENK